MNSLQKMNIFYGIIIWLVIGVLCCIVLFYIITSWSSDVSSQQSWDIDVEADTTLSLSQFEKQEIVDTQIGILNDIVSFISNYQWIDDIGLAREIYDSLTPSVYIGILLQRDKSIWDKLMSFTWDYRRETWEKGFDNFEEYTKIFDRYYNAVTEPFIIESVDDVDRDFDIILSSMDESQAFSIAEQLYTWDDLNSIKRGWFLYRWECERIDKDSIKREYCQKIHELYTQ